MMNRIARERGFTPLDRAGFEAATELRGATLVGSPEQVAEKILFQHEFFEHREPLFGSGIISPARTSSLGDPEVLQ